MKKISKFLLTLTVIMFFTISAQSQIKKDTLIKRDTIVKPILHNQFRDYINWIIEQEKKNKKQKNEFTNTILWRKGDDV